MPHRNRLNRLLFLGIVAIGVFVLLVGSRDITSSHEGRVAATARTMADAGWPWDADPVSVPEVRLTDKDGELRLSSHSDADTMRVNPWMIPVLDGHIRLQKPPLPYWCDAVMFRLMGRSALSARLIPALLGLLATLLIYDLARMLMERSMAWLAALLWLSSYFIPEEYRKTMADPYLAFFTLGCVWAWIKGAMENGKWKMAVHFPLLVFYIFLALGLLAKGPPLLAHLVIAIGAFHLCYRRRAPGKWWMHGLGVLLVLLIASPWVIYVYTHIPHVVAIWRYESVGEMTDNVENARAWWFYLPQLPLVALPWIGLWALGLIRPFFGSSAGRRRRKWRPFFPLIWYAGTILFFSFVNLKKNAYLLPAMPAQTLLMAQGAMLLAVWLKCRPRRSLPRIIVVAQACVGAGFALWLGWALFFSPLAQPLWIAAGLWIVAIIAATYPLWQSLRLDSPTADHPASSGGVYKYKHWLLAQAVGYALLLSLFFNFYDAPKENRTSPRPFIAAVMPLLEQPHCTLARHQLKPEVAFYLPEGLPPFDPSAECVHVIAERSKRRSAAGIDDFANFGLTRPVMEMSSVQLPRFKHWKLLVLKTPPAKETSQTPRAAFPPPGSGPDVRQSDNRAAGSSSTGSPAGRGSF